MGIRGLQTFMEQTDHQFNDIKLRNCNVVLDGNSIYHQMYIQNDDLKCFFGGEYDKFHCYCTQLFESFLKCNISAIVVFDGAQLNDSKLATTIHRAEQNIEKSASTDPEVTLSPLLLRQTFISVLNTMKIPYVAALGEGDDECVSLANHLNCYLMATDSDYFCYNLRRGYIPFGSVEINPIEEDSLFYLSVQSYHIDSLLRRFRGLTLPTLALACCLCGNDYIDKSSTRIMINYINANVRYSKPLQGDESRQTKDLWNAMQWMRNIYDIDSALALLLPLIRLKPERNDIEIQLHRAVQCYLKPSDTLIYRFISPNNENLRASSHFVQLARSYLDTLGINDTEITAHVDNDSQSIKTKHGQSLPLFWANAVSDLRVSPSFVEILIHRRLILRAHIEFEREPSIFSHAIPILLSCFAILLKWDQEQHDSNVIIYHRVNQELEKVPYPIENLNDNVPQLDQIRSVSLDERQNFVRQCLEMPHELLHRWDNIPSDYHFWLMIIRYWYTKRALLPVYLYAVIVSLIKYVCLRNDHDSELVKEQFDSLLSAFNTHQRRQQIQADTREVIFSDLENMSKKVLKKKRFNRRIIHELNCLQTVYMHSLQVNKFFNKPYQSPVHPQHFICGSFFYGFVEHYKTKQHMNNLPDSMHTLFRNETFLVNFLDNLFQCILPADQNALFE